MEHFRLIVEDDMMNKPIINMGQVSRPISIDVNFSYLGESHQLDNNMETIHYFNTTGQDVALVSQSADVIYIKKSLVMDKLSRISDDIYGRKGIFMLRQREVCLDILERKRDFLKHLGPFKKGVGILDRQIEELYRRKNMIDFGSLPTLVVPEVEFYPADFEGQEGYEMEGTRYSIHQVDTDGLDLGNIEMIKEGIDAPIEAHILDMKFHYKTNVYTEVQTVTVPMRDFNMVVPLRHSDLATPGLMAEYRGSDGELVSTLLAVGPSTDIHGELPANTTWRMSTGMEVAIGGICHPESISKDQIMDRHRWWIDTLEKSVESELSLAEARGKLSKIKEQAAETEILVSKRAATELDMLDKINTARRKMEFNQVQFAILEKAEELKIQKEKVKLKNLKKLGKLKEEYATSAFVGKLLGSALSKYI